MAMTGCYLYNSNPKVIKATTVKADTEERLKAVTPNIESIVTTNKIFIWGHRIENFSSFLFEPMMFYFQLESTRKVKILNSYIIQILISV